MNRGRENLSPLRRQYWVRRQPHWNVAAGEPAGIFPWWPELDPGRSFKIHGRYLVREFDFASRLRRWLTPTKPQTTQFAWLN